MNNRHLPDQQVLLRLIREALMVFNSCSDNFHARACSGAAMALSGEPVADLNYLMLTADSKAARQAFTEYVEYCDASELPFAAMIAPEAISSAQKLCKSLNLTYATDWPQMVCDAELARDHPVSGVRVRPMAGKADLIAMSEVLASAFHMPKDAVQRAMPQALTESPSIEIFMAERYGAIQSTVTVTYHGDVAGIWAMGTLGIAQGEGVGKALLSRVMVDARDQGIRSFFLGATPAGFPLYQNLGYETVFEAQAWVRGETHQA